jgi:uroporphyrinogen-III decarboxylase
MTELQWDTLNKVIRGEYSGKIPTGFIIDCPWLPQWYGISTLDYFTSDKLWFDANLKACNEFKDVIFLPGFWSEYGMCTEPSAFGAKSTFFRNEFPHAHPIIFTSEDIDKLTVPNPETDGLLPFMLNRLLTNEDLMRQAGHEIKFSVSRGPLNIASYLMGLTEFLMLMMMEPEKCHLLIRKITDFLISWHSLQKEKIPAIEGIMMLDDIIGFMGETEFLEFGLPYFKEIYSLFGTVKFLHNDASCEASVKHLPEMGINLFNMAFDTDLNHLKEVTGNKVTMLGNIPPRDVMAAGNEEDVEKSLLNLIDGLNDKKQIILSCGGGMPPMVNTSNINRFIKVASRTRIG